MQFLLESPAAVAAIGVFCVTCAGIVFAQSRSRGALAAVVACVLLTIGGVVAERLVRTPHEQVLGAVADLFAAIEENDLAAVLSLIDPAATSMRADAEELMPQFRVQSAGQGGEVIVTLPADPQAEGALAGATLKPLIKVVHKKTGSTGAYFDGLELDLVRRGDAWRLAGYRPAKDWRTGAARLGR